MINYGWVCPVCERVNNPTNSLCAGACKYPDYIKRQEPVDRVPTPAELIQQALKQDNWRKIPQNGNPVDEMPIAPTRFPSCHMDSAKAWDEAAEKLKNQRAYLCGESDGDEL